MSEREIQGPTEEDLRLIVIARQRLANRLGGQWAVYATTSYAETQPTAQPPVEIVSQERIAEDQNENVQKLQELGMLAVGSKPDRSPYLAR